MKVKYLLRIKVIRCPLDWSKNELTKAMCVPNTMIAMMMVIMIAKNHESRYGYESKMPTMNSGYIVEMYMFITKTLVIVKDHEYC